MSEFNSFSAAGAVPGEGYLTPYRIPGNHCGASFVRPLYSVYSLGSSCHKVCKFHDAYTDMSRLKLPKEHQETVLDSGRWRTNIIRAKTTITELILSNDWSYFFTGTLDPVRYDRFNLARFKSHLSQFMRDQRKKWGREGVKSFWYVLVPEQHEDGAWHIHGVLGGIPGEALASFSGNVPQRLIDGSYLNWPDYQKKFGFCSLGSIKDPVACAFYIRKYIAKGFTQDDFARHEHMFLASVGLQRRQHISDYFTPDSVLESCLDTFNPWVDRGYVYNMPWYFGFDGEVIFETLAPISFPAVDPEGCPEWEEMQLSLSDLCSDQTIFEGRRIF